MTTLHLMVGLPGVGKTTLALDLAQSLPALRLSADDLQLALYGDDVAHPDHNARHDAIEAALWPLALGALRAGVDAILDFGFWSRDERQHLRALAAAAGFGSALQVPPDPGPVTRLQRIAGRKVGFTVTAADMAGYEALYEPPGPDELTPRPAP